MHRYAEHYLAPLLFVTLTACGGSGGSHSVSVNSPQIRSSRMWIGEGDKFIIDVLHPAGGSEYELVSSATGNPQHLAVAKVSPSSFEITAFKEAGENARAITPVELVLRQADHDVASITVQLVDSEARDVCFSQVKRSGEPLAGALVGLFSNGSMLDSVMTDNEGWFAFDHAQNTTVAVLSQPR